MVLQRNPEQWSNGDGMRQEFPGVDTATRPTCPGECEPSYTYPPPCWAILIENRFWTTSKSKFVLGNTRDAAASIS